MLISERIGPSLAGKARLAQTKLQMLSFTSLIAALTTQFQDLANEGPRLRQRSAPKLNRHIDQTDGRTGTFSFRRLLAAARQTTTLLGLTALIVGNVSVAIYLDRQERKEIETAHHNASNLATAFEQHTVRAIRSVDQALLVARAEYERDPRQFNIEKLMARDYFPKDLAIQVAVIGADGWMRASNFQTSTSIDLSDREHFRYHVDNPLDELFISKPVLGRASNVWTVQFTRKLRDANGHFGGVLVASVDPRLLSRLYDSVDVGKSGAITVWGTDGIVRARSGMGGDVLGRMLSNQSVARVNDGASSGNYETASVVDGVARIVSFRKISGYPLVVTIALGRDEVLADFEQSKFVLARLMLLIDGALLIIMGLGTSEKYRHNTLRERLDDKAQTLASTLANMQEGILMTDAQGRVLTINDHALDLLGLESSKLSVPILYADLPLLKIEEKLGGALQPRLEIEYRPECILEVRTSPLADGGFVKTITDITERRRSQDMLLEARDSAETASRIRTAFLATMSHEIRTPVAGIVSMADLIATTPLDHMQSRYVEITRELAEHLLTLLSDVLDVTKLDADQISLETIRFDLFRELLGALDILGNKATEKDLVLGCAIAPDVPREITGDPSRLRQVLLNLIGNAIKFTPSGHVLLNVTRLRDGMGDRLLISIEDTGIGIANENQRDLFRDFSQIDSSISRRFGGTGLGLAISRKLINRMGGSIGVRSEMGKGSTFYFEIPLKDFVEPTPILREKAAIAIASPDAFERELIERQVSLAYSDVAAFATYEGAQAWLRAAGAGRRILLTELSLVPNAIQSLGGLDWDVFLLCTRQDFLAYEHANELSCAGLVQKPIFLDDMRETLSQSVRTSAQVGAVASVSPLAGKLNGLDVLLAEDNATIQFALRRMLENMGAQVTTANDGREALEHARAQSFDVILMDVMMPELDGLGATRAIRAMDGPHQKTPIIALTASAFAEDREAAFAAGMNAFATKPITARGLLTSIEDCLRRALDPISQESPRSQSLDDVPALDRHFLHQVAEDLGPQHLAQALNVFLKDLEQRAQALHQEGSDADRLRKAAHAIKGSAASFGFKRLAQMAQDLEDAARSGEMARFSELKDRIMREAALAPEHVALV